VMEGYESGEKMSVVVEKWRFSAGKNGGLA
jgi:hypothetical protein